MSTGIVSSADGTKIEWTREGTGPPLVMVHCVAVSRATSPQPTLPHALAQDFTVFTYDRRGTGTSGSTPPYSTEREFEDLAAVIGLASEPADVYGFSSGATLALLAAEAGVPIRRLALLEPPLSDEPDPGDALLSETPAARFADVQIPTLVMASDRTAPELLTAASQLEQCMPCAVRRILPGDWHSVDDGRITEAVRNHLTTYPIGS